MNFRRLFFFLIALISALSLPFPDTLESQDRVTIARVFHIIGHRGAAGSAPENTIRAFSLATEAGADMLELDVRQTKDSQLVVIHDEDVDRTTDGTGDVGNLTLGQIRALDAGSWFDPRFSDLKVPTLEEVFDSIPSPHTFLIEIKDGSETYPGIEERVIRLIRDRRLTQRVILKSFDDEVLSRLRAMAPEIRRLKIVVFQVSFLGIIIEHGIQFGTVLDDSVQYLQHHQFGLSRSFIEEAHERGYGIFAWGVNDTDRMKELIRDGVDGIETDYPETLRSLIADH